MYCIADVNETPVPDSVVGMKGAIENHLANIGTQISPTMLFFEKAQRFSPTENNAQVEVGFTPPGSYTCAKLSSAEKSHPGKSTVKPTRLDFFF